MSGVTSLALRQEMLAEKFLGQAATWTAMTIALTRRVPTTNSSALQLDEPVGMAYARVAVNLGALSWMAINDNEVANSGTLYFPTATGSWGTMHGWAAIGGGKVIATGTVNDPIRVVSGIRPVLSPGALVFGLFDG